MNNININVNLLYFRKRIQIKKGLLKFPKQLHYIKVDFLVMILLALLLSYILLYDCCKPASEPKKN